MTARLSLLVVTLLALAGCSKPERVDAPEGTPVHLADDWFAFRGAELRLTPEQARTRDDTISEETPPASLDASVLREAAADYRQLCATCHGAEGTPPATLADGGPPPRRWGGAGTRMGFTFGGDKMRRGIYRTIRHGGEPKEDKPSRMPSWESQLSREQAWALARYLESL